MIFAIIIGVALGIILAPFLAMFIGAAAGCIHLAARTVCEKFVAWRDHSV